VARPVWGVLPLPLLLVALLLAAPTAQADPFHLQIGNDALGSERAIHGQQWVAQSFVPTQDFFLSRIALYVRDRGPSEALSLEVRPDFSGFPGAGALAGTSGAGPIVADWFDFDFSPYLAVEQARTYWIVASTSAVDPQGYDWWRSGSNTAYLPGTGALSPDGVNWTYDTEDYAFRVYGFQQPNLTFSVTVSRSTLDAGQFAAFGVNLTNAGLGSASRVWVNISLPSGLTYVDDDAALIGGVRNGSLNFRFTNLSAGPWSFRLTVVGANVPDGTVAETRFTFEGTDHNGNPSTRVVETEAITIRNPGFAVWVWWVLGLAAILIGGALFLLVRRRSNRPSVEEVFVIHRNGILLAHESKTLTPDKDADILAAMLKTVQDFVQETFSTSERLPMRGLHFGEFNILIEPGRTHNVAVVYRGRDDGTLAARTKALSELIETRFGSTLESWSGDVREVRGIRSLLPVLWGRRPDANPVRARGEDPANRQGDATAGADREMPTSGERVPANPPADEEG